MIKGIQEAVSIPVMAKCRIGHFAEAQILQAIEIDYIDESEVSDGPLTAVTALNLRKRPLSYRRLRYSALSVSSLSYLLVSPLSVGSGSLSFRLNFANSRMNSLNCVQER